MSKLLSLAVIAVVACLMALVVKKDAPQMASLITIIAGIYLLLYILSCTSQVIDGINAVMSFCNVDTESIMPLIKILGISVVSKITSEICRDMGEGAMAAKIELLGVVLAVIITLPVLNDIIGIFNNLI